LANQERAVGCRAETRPLKETARQGQEERAALKFTDGQQRKAAAAKSHKLTHPPHDF